MLDQDVRERVARIEVLLEQAENLADPGARETAMELVQALLDLYGEGLARIVDHVAEHDGDGLGRALAADELVAHLLLLHGLHPLPLDARVRGALEEVRPYLESHGGGVELLGVADRVVRLRLEGSCEGCPSSAATLELAIEDAIHAAAPDVERVEAEGAAPAAPAPALLQLEVTPAVRRSWSAVGALADLDDGGALLRDVAGEPVLFLRLDHKVYAYRSACPRCGAAMEGAALRGRELACGSCGDRYDVRRAGRGLDAPDRQLPPVPLLVDHEGAIKIALGAAG